MLTVVSDRSFNLYHVQEKKNYNTLVIQELCQGNGDPHYEFHPENSELQSAFLNGMIHAEGI